MNVQKTTSTIIFIFLISAFNFLKAQVPTPASEQKLPIVIIGATIHIGNGEVIEKGTIIIKNGIITAIGEQNKVQIDKSPNETIDATGKHVYPGFINVNNTLGLREIDAVRATKDFSETGAMNPHVRAMIAFNTESKVAMTVRSNGVLITQATPRGGRISGQSAVMKLDGWNWEDAQIKSSDGIHLNWVGAFSHKWTNGELRLEKNKNKEKSIQQLNQFFINAKAYGLEHKESDMRLDAMQSVLKGETNLYIHTNSAKDIIESVKFAQKHNVKKIVIVEGKESYLVADFLKENNIPVMLGRVHSLPMYQDEPVMTQYQIAAKLDKAGVMYCLNWSGDMEAANSRNLAFGAGSTVGHGVEYEKAIASITLNPAKILGIDKKYGSLELKKSATLIISDGDALDIRTNNISYALIDGKVIDLNNHQKELSKKYSKKLGLESGK